jgi:hypothetical protein
VRDEGLDVGCLHLLHMLPHDPRNFVLLGLAQVSRMAGRRLPTHGALQGGHVVLLECVGEDVAHRIPVNTDDVGNPCGQGRDGLLWDGEVTAGLHRGERVKDEREHAVLVTLGHLHALDALRDRLVPRMSFVEHGGGDDLCWVGPLRGPSLLHARMVRGLLGLLGGGTVRGCLPCCRRCLPLLGGGRGIAFAVVAAALLGIASSGPCRNSRGLRHRRGPRAKAVLSARRRDQERILSTAIVRLAP